jgi:hypothetical protein
MRESDIPSRLPRGLAKAYDELWARIRSQPGSAPVIAERAIKRVMCSMRPLTSAELAAAGCQDSTSSCIRPVDVDISIILHACCNLLVEDAQRGTCGFAHLSVQEYFANRVWTIYQAHVHAAATCLALLKSIDFQQMTSLAPPCDVDERRAHYPAAGPDNAGVKSMLRYVVLYWMCHVQRLEVQSADPRIATTKRFPRIDRC